MTDRSTSGGAAARSTAGGLCIVGCGSACGKTVVATGLAGTLAQEGFAVRAIKPIVIGSERSARAELAFMSKISHSPITYPVQYLSDPGTLKLFAFNEALRVCRAGTATTLVELPGSAATPLVYSSSLWRDVADFAAELGFPALLVGEAGPESVERLLLNSAYLTARAIDVIGMTVVETREGGLSCLGIRPADAGGDAALEALAIALKERTGVNFVGVVGYSQSVSVPAVNQGNLIKKTSGGLDLLPLIKALNLRLSV